MLDRVIYFFNVAYKYSHSKHVYKKKKKNVIYYRDKESNSQPSKLIINFKRFRSKESINLINIFFFHKTE